MVEFLFLVVKQFEDFWLTVPFFQLQENQDEIENMMNAIFKGVFVHRYRYVDFPTATHFL